MTMFSTLGEANYVLHHPSRVDLYAVTREQLELLSLSAQSDWKGYFQNSFSVLLTCVINVLALGFDTSNASFILNLGLGALSLLICIFSFYMKHKDDRKYTDRLTEILKQPVQPMKIDEQDLDR